MILLSDMKAQVLTFEDVKLSTKQFDKKYYHLDTTNQQRLICHQLPHIEVKCLSNLVC